MRDQRVWLNDIEFAEIHPALILQHISEAEPKITYKTAARAGGGSFPLSRNVERLEITLEFAIREAYDFSARMAALQAVRKWAWAGGWLQLSDHPGQRIYVDMSTAPGMGKLREWNNDLAITFTASWYPYWEDILPDTASYSGANGYTSIINLGTGPAYLAATIVPQSEALAYATITTPTTSMQLDLSDIPVPAGAQLIIWYDDKHLLHIAANNQAALRTRTGDDHLICMPGANQIGVSFNTACNCSFAVRGVWL